MIETFRASYSDESLSKILVSAKTNPYTEKLAANLQNALLNT